MKQRKGKSEVVELNNTRNVKNITKNNKFIIYLKYQYVIQD